MKVSGKPSLLKKINKNIILNIIRNHDSISNTQLSKITGISKPTMYKTILSLEKDGFIKKAGLGDVPSVGGRRPVLYKFNGDMGYLIGSQIRVNEIVTILTNFNSDIKSKVIIKIGNKRDIKSVADKLFDSFNHVLKDSGVKRDELKYIGIGLHGIVNHKKGILLGAGCFSEWQENINFTDIVEKEFKVKTFVDNYCRMQVFAEKLFGIGKKYRNILAIETGAGLAAGVIIDNKIHRGNSFLAGEIGLTSINLKEQSYLYNYEEDFEALVSTDSLKDRVRKKLPKYKESELFKKFGKNVNKIKLTDIFSAYIKGDKFVEKIMDEIENYLAVGIGNAILHYDPEITILQGDYLGAKEKFLNRLKVKIDKNLSSLLRIKIENNIQFSKLGKFIGPIGSVSLVLDQSINLLGRNY